MILLVTMSSGQVAAQISNHAPEVEIKNDGYELTQSEYLAAEKGISFITSRYTTVFGFSFDKNLDIRLRVFGDFYSYKVYQIGFSHSTTNCAFYSAKFNEAIVWRRKKHTTLLKDIYHEVNHLLFRNIKSSSSSDFVKRPLWLNEGLSEYFERLVVRREDISIKLQASKAERCKKWVEEGSMIPLKDYLSQSNKEWKRNETKELGYQSRSVAWSLIYFLMNDIESQKILGKVIRHIEQNQETEGISYKAIQRHYPGGVAKLEQDWHKWILSDFQAHSFSLPVTYLPNIHKKTPVHIPISRGM
ncbi:DUF1570 domain-containing protein [Flammeovirgaceae bacterium SG7u.111]|nr:DUF1570 domain-containing protein [Flammeovirgaceae bacterium SG7u.132]WPO33333.1 DUF1570 domain-containing protein [Flammeovirgaceae bacterium SG7u.111]